MTPEQFMALIEKHAATISFELLFDLAEALNLKLGVKVIDRDEPPVVVNG